MSVLYIIEHIRSRQTISIVLLYCTWTYLFPEL